MRRNENVGFAGGKDVRGVMGGMGESTAMAEGDDAGYEPADLNGDAGGD